MKFLSQWPSASSSLSPDRLFARELCVTVNIVLAVFTSQEASRGINMQSHDFCLHAWAGSLFWHVGFLNLSAFYQNVTDIAQDSPGYFPMQPKMICGPAVQLTPSLYPQLVIISFTYACQWQLFEHSFTSRCILDICCQRFLITTATAHWTYAAFCTWSNENSGSVTTWSHVVLSLGKFDAFTGEATDALVEENSIGDVYLDQDGITKRSAELFQWDPGGCPKVDCAFDVLGKMINAGCQPTLWTYDVLIKGLKNEYMMVDQEVVTLPDAVSDCSFNVFSASNLDKERVSCAGHLKTVSSQGVGYGGRLISKNNTQIKCFVAAEEEAEMVCSISVHAPTGSAADVSGLIQLQAFIADHEILILIDSRSSTSFINQQLAAQLSGIQPLPKPGRVTVADGSQHRCATFIPKCQRSSQGHCNGQIQCSAISATELTTICRQDSIANHIGVEHFQGGRYAITIATIFKQGSVDHKYYPGFDQYPAHNDYFLSISFDRVSIGHYCFYLVAVYPGLNYHHDSDQLQEQRVQWDPGGRRLGVKPSFKEGGMLGTSLTRTGTWACPVDHTWAGPIRAVLPATYTWEMATSDSSGNGSGTGGGDSPFSHLGLSSPIPHFMLKLVSPISYPPL